MTHLHYPVMNKEVLSLFKSCGGGIFIDCTVGMGGHAELILKGIADSEVIAIDMDKESLEIAKVNLKRFKERVRFEKLEFKNLFRLSGIEWGRVKGMLVDPGLSMYQLKSGERGFSFSIDEKLDMRKDRSSGITAEKVINTFSENELAEIFEKYGDLNRAKQLAKRIIERRLFDSVDTTSKLRKIVEQFYRWRPVKGKSHPAAKVFQALRIFVNSELKGIEKFILKIPGYLKKGSVFIFLTYHSTEDRTVKFALKKLASDGAVKLIKPFPMKPGDEEIRKNFPSRSAKLRAVELL